MQKVQSHQRYIIPFRVHCSRNYPGICFTLTRRKSEPLRIGEQALHLYTYLVLAHSRISLRSHNANGKYLRIAGHVTGSGSARTRGLHEQQQKQSFPFLRVYNLILLSGASAPFFSLLDKTSMPVARACHWPVARGLPKRERNCREQLIVGDKGCLMDRRREMYSDLVFQMGGTINVGREGARFIGF